ncbi:MAG TPA: DNA-3-methyladenine glycosylase I [Acidimicrobiales bacterium]|nr:DNA-3-methyladenine glycosylase I [Acidimicrobiales bacterium]
MTVSDALAAGPDGRLRCFWAVGGAPEYLAYHDEEWGRPALGDRDLFERLTLEAFQSGLSWLTILRKREAFRAGFAGFDIPTVAAFGPDDVARLLADAGIVRHRGKIEAAIGNARAALDVIAAEGSLATLCWRFEPVAGPAPIDGGDVAATTPESVALSRELKRRGFRFVGPTTVHAFFQAMGLVNEHLDGCWVRDEVEHERAAVDRATLVG